MAQTSQWPIIERPAALRKVAAGLERAPASVQLIVGTAGVGKSVLAQQVADGLDRRSVHTVVGLSEQVGVPLGAFAPTLVALGLGTDLEAAIPALLGLLGREPQQHLLIVDDAPRLDDLSASTVYQLVRGFGVAVIATARLGERLPNPLARLVDEGMVEEHALCGFDRASVAELLEARFDGRARHADVLRLVDRTEGNPLFLRVLLEAAARDGAVRRTDEFIEIEEGSTPPGLLMSVADTLAGLPIEQRRVLRLISLMQPTDSRHFQSETAVIAQIDALLLRGLLIREAGSRRLRVAHPLISEALQQDATLDAVTSEAVARMLAAGDHASRFAAINLQTASGEAVEPEMLLWAADHAFALGELRIAADFAERTLATESEQAGLRLRAWVVLASARSTAGELDAADRAFAEATRYASRPEEHALLATRQGEHLAFRRFDARAAVEVVEHAQTLLPPRMASALDSELRLWRGLLGQVHERSADLSAAETHPELAIRSAMASIMTDSMDGRTDAAREAAGVLARVQERLGVLDPAAAAMIGFDVYFDLLSKGEHERALALAESRRLTAGDGVGIWTSTVAEHLSYNGRLTEARRVSSLAVDQCRWRDVVGVLALALAVQADTTAKAGDLVGARLLLDSMEPAQRAEPKAVMMIAECEAWLAQAGGDRERAAAIVADAADAASDLGFRLVASISLGLCIRLGVFDRAAEKLETLCAEVPPGFGLYTALRDLGTALRDRQPERVPDAAVRLARAGMAPTALDGVSLALRMGPRQEVRRRLDIVTTMISEGVDAPLLQTRTSPLLSVREQRVALAAANRERSREIALGLGVSVRTVDNQLQSAYRKLGIRSRDELREVLDELGMLAPPR